jgi:hypothetical protein
MCQSRRQGIWGLHGLKDFVCIPVATLNFTGHDAVDKVRREEQWWIDRFNSMAPLGYNKIRAVSLERFEAMGGPVRPWEPPRRTYGYHTMVRRIRALCFQVKHHRYKCMMMRVFTSNLLSSN